MDEPVGRRIPNSSHEAGNWRIGEIVPDFTLEDAWEMPISGGAGEFPEALALLSSSNPANAKSLPTRLLWRLRERLGSWFERDDSAPTIPGTNETSLAGRLPDDLRGTAGDARFAALPFAPLFRTGDEFAAEIGNRTMHGVMHVAWAPRGDGTYQAELAVYVKPNGRLGTAYMTAIKPFRHLIVYPALMRQSKRAWAKRRTSAPSR